MEEMGVESCCSNYIYKCIKAKRFLEGYLEDGTEEA